MNSRTTSTLLFILCLVLGTAAELFAQETSLATTKAAYEKALEKVDADYEDELQSALSQYGAGVEMVRETLQKQGVLEGLIVAMREKRRFKTEQTVPVVMPLDFPELLGKLWTKYNEVVAEAESDRAKKAAALKRRYVAKLEGLKKDLTVANKLTEALKVKAELEQARPGGKRTTAVASETVACSRCGGTGKVTGVCDVCGGTGRCRTCRGTGFVNSKLGTGKSKCLTCRGTGDCYSCEGAGRSTAGVCPVCNGKGRVNGPERTANSGVHVRARRKDEPKPMSPEETKKEMEEYVQTMGSLNDLFRLSRFESAEFIDVLSRPEKYLLKVLKSTVYLMDGHPRGVRVSSKVSPGQNEVVLMIPSTMWVGSKAKKLMTTVGQGGKVVITYAIVNDENTTLFDIELPPGYEHAAASE